MMTRLLQAMAKFLHSFITIYILTLSIVANTSLYMLFSKIQILCVAVFY